MKQHLYLGVSECVFEKEKERERTCVNKPALKLCPELGAADWKREASSRNPPQRTP